jgi:hypothetical protein
MGKKYKFGFNLPVTKKRIEMTDDELKADKLLRMHTKKKKAKARTKYKNTHSAQALKMYDKEKDRLNKLIDKGDYSQLLGYDILDELKKEQNKLYQQVRGYGFNYGSDLLAGIAKENSLAYYNDLINQSHKLYSDSSLTQQLAEQSKLMVDDFQHRMIGLDPDLTQSIVEQSNLIGTGLQQQNYDLSLGLSNGLEYLSKSIGGDIYQQEIDNLTKLSDNFSLSNINPTVESVDALLNNEQYFKNLYNLPIQQLEQALLGFGTTDIFNQYASLNLNDIYSDFSTRYLNEYKYLENIEKPQKNTKKSREIFKRVIEHYNKVGNAYITAKEFAILMYPYKGQKTEIKNEQLLIILMVKESKIEFAPIEGEEHFLLMDFIKYRKEKYPDEDLEFGLPELNTLSSDEEKTASALTNYKENNESTENETAETKNVMYNSYVLVAATLIYLKLSPNKRIASNKYKDIIQSMEEADDEYGLQIYEYHDDKKLSYIPEKQKNDESEIFYFGNKNDPFRNIKHAKSDIKNNLQFYFDRIMDKCAGKTEFQKQFNEVLKTI